MLVGLVCAGCVKKDEPPPREAEPAVAISPLADIRTLVLPLDYYRVDAKARAQIHVARTELFFRCMRRFGFSYPVPAPPRPLPFAEHERRYGIATEERAARHGYHNNEAVERATEAREAEKAISLTAEGAAVAEGTATNVKGGEQVPPGGCHGETARKLAEGAPKVEDTELVEKLISRNYARATGDSRVQRAFADWSACMAKAGYNYPTPLAASEDPAFNTPGPSPRELQVTTQDVRCKVQTNLLSIWSSVETAYQKREIERNTQVLADHKKLLDARVRNAATVTATG